MLDKIDSREVYEDNQHVDCPCDADKACVYCIDGEMYGEITTTAQDQLPTPPDVIYVSAEVLQEALLAVTKEAGGYVDGEQAAYYSGSPIECRGYLLMCECGTCTAREYRIINGGMW